MFRDLICSAVVPDVQIAPSNVAISLDTGERRRLWTGDTMRDRAIRRQIADNSMRDNLFCPWYTRWQCLNSDLAR